MDEAMQDELRGLLDREQLRALVDRYFATVDDGGLDVEWARTIFSEDVRIEHRTFTMTGLDEVTFGHQVVRDGWAQTFHASTNVRIDLAGDEARLTGRLVAIHLHLPENPPEPYVIANRFEADAVRTPAGWRFRSLTQHVVWSHGRSHLDLAAGGAS